jgi:hypothetical protein
MTIESSPLDDLDTSSRVLVGTATASARRMLVLDEVILLWVYKVVDMKYSR